MLLFNNYYNIVDIKLDLFICKKIFFMLKLLLNKSKKH